MYTAHVQGRYKEHKSGSLKCRYTRSFPPKKLLAFWPLETESDALSVESKIKKLPKKQKRKVDSCRYERLLHKINS